MIPAPLPPDEVGRLAALSQLRLLEGGREPAFDRLTHLTADLFNVPVALVSLVTDDRQVFKGSCGITAEGSAREIAFCAHAILADEVMVVHDARLDPRFVGNPFVTARPGIRFYAGAPLKVAGGFRLGTLCIIDWHPRAFGPDERRRLAALATCVVDLIEFRLGHLMAEENRRKAEAAAAAKSTFLSVISHELRTPLTSIKGALGLMKAGAAGALEERARRLVSIAHDNTERLLHLINDLLDMQRIAAGRLEFRCRPVGLIALVRQSLEQNRPFAERFGVSFRFDPPEEEIEAWVDPDRLLQVMANLLSNAAKFSPKGGKVTVRLARCDGCARLSVIDQGPGIPEEFRDRLFQPFAQADSSSRRSREGTGLGLSISKGIVERLNGCLGCDSEPGRGATFHVDLPLDCPSPEEVS
ncbi:MAG TPA: GAF domain-containing sensor histidine kinase [Azospirillaceae bacterium]|nr:GAF domain-containing sensor histidine kinase [Azospirillaceae bacterium]